ncbi:Negative elongation factor B [Aphelenchoides fujianensis]|nr:Negative elongation factor B [Aphelenchoides fujianensis]
MIGLHEKLFHRLVDMIRERFEKTESPHYCSLRSEIVMCLHDLNVDYIVQQDPTHDFVWVLHAIVRDRHLDNQQTTKLKGLLDKKKVAEANLGSMAMAAADPYVLYFLCISAIRVLTEHARQCTSLPRESPLLHVVVRLLYLGTSASRILNERISEQKAVVDVQCLTRFLPLLLARMAADRFRAELKRAPEELSNEFIGEVAERPLDEVEEFVSADVVPALFLLSYVLELLAAKRRLLSAHPLVDYLRVLCEAKDKIAMQDPWAHVLAARLIQSPSADVLFADPDFVHVVVHLFTTGIQHNPNNRFHLLRLCNALHAQLGNDVVERILQAITPADGMTHEPEYAGQSSAARFPKELRRFIVQRARKETSSPPPLEVPIPIVDAPALSPDLLSKMLDEE